MFWIFWPTYVDKTLEGNAFEKRTVPRTFGIASVLNLSRIN
jgi:hypothetical protein